MEEEERGSALRASLPKIGEFFFVVGEVDKKRVLPAVSSNKEDNAMSRSTNVDRTSNNTTKRPSKVLYSCIVRGETLLVHAGDLSQADIRHTIRDLLEARPARLGWDIYTSDAHSGRKGIKFHIYQARLDGTGVDTWIYACVYNSKRTSRNTAQTFLMKLVILTETARQTNLAWKEGDVLACQNDYGPLLMQQMLQVRSLKASLILTSTMALARVMIMQNRKLLNEQEERQQQGKRQGWLPMTGRTPSRRTLQGGKQLARFAHSHSVSDSEPDTDRDEVTDQEDNVGRTPVGSITINNNNNGLLRQVNATVDEDPAPPKDLGLTVEMASSFDSADRSPFPVPPLRDMQSPRSTMVWGEQSTQHQPLHSKNVLAPQKKDDLSPPRLRHDDDGDNDRSEPSVLPPRLSYDSPMIVMGPLESRQLPSRGSDMELSTAASLPQQGLSEDEALIQENQALSKKVDELRIELERLRTKSTENKDTPTISGESHSLRGELQNMHQLIDEVVSENSNFMKDHEETLHELRSKEKELVVVVNRLKQAQSEIDKVKAELEQNMALHRGEKENLEAQLQSEARYLREELSRARQEKESILAEKEDLVTQHKRSVQLLQSNARELTAQSQKVISMAERINTDESRVLQLELELDQIRTQVLREKEEMDRILQVERESFKAKLDHVRESKDEVVAESKILLRKLEERARKLESTETEVQEKMEAVRKMLMREKEELARQAEEERQSLQKELVELRKTVREKDELATMHAQTVQNLRNDLDDLQKAMVAKAEKHTQRSEEERRSFQQELSELRRAAEEAHCEKEILAEKHARIVEALESKERELNEINRRVDSLCSDKEELINRARELDVQVVAAKKEQQALIGKMQDEANQLREAYDSIITEKEEITEEHTRIVELLESSEQKLADKSQLLDSAYSEKEQVLSELEKVKDEIRKATEERQVATDKVRQSLSEAEEMRRAKDEVLAQNESLVGKHTYSLELLEAKEKELSATLASLDELRLDNKKLETQIARERQENAEQTELQRNVSIQEKDELNQARSEVEKENEVLAEKHAQLVQLLHLNEEKLENHAKSLGALRAENTSLIAELNTLQMQFKKQEDEYQVKAAQASEQTQSLRAEMDTLQQAKQAAETAKETLAVENSSIVEQLRSKEQETAGMIAQLQSLDSERAALLAELDNFRARAADELEALVAKARAEKDSQQGEIQELLQANMDALKEMDCLTIEHVDLVLQLKTKEHVLQAELDELKDRLIHERDELSKKAKNEKQVLQERITSLQLESEEFQTKTDALHVKLNEAVQHGRAKKQELAKTSERCSQMLIEVEDLRKQSFVQKDEYEARIDEERRVMRDVLKNTLQAKEKAIAEKEELEQQHDQATQKLQSMVEQLELQLEEVQSKMARENTEQVRKSSEDIHSLAVAIDQVRQAKAEVEAENERLSRLQSETVKQLQETKQEIVAQSGRLAEATKRLEATQNEYKEEIMMLKKLHEEETRHRVSTLEESYASRAQAYEDRISNLQHQAKLAAVWHQSDIEQQKNTFEAELQLHEERLWEEMTRKTRDELAVLQREIKVSQDERARVEEEHSAVQMQPENSSRISFRQAEGLQFQDQVREEEMKRLRENIVKLNQQLADKDMVIARLDQEIEDTETRKEAHVRATKSHHADEEVEHEEALSCLRKEAARAERQFHSQISSLTEKMEAEQKEHEVVLKSVKQELEQTRHELSDARESVREYLLLKRRLDELHDSYDHVQEELSVAEEKRKRVLVEGETAVLELQAKREAIETAVKLKDQKMSEMEKQFQATSERVARDHQCELDALKNDLAAIDEDLRRGLSALQRETAEKEQYQAEIEILNERLGRLQEVDEMNMDLKLTVVGLREEVLVCTEELYQNKRELEDARQQLKEQETQARALIDANMVSAESLVKVQEKLVTEKQSNKNLLGRIKDMEAALAAKERELDASAKIGKPEGGEYIPAQQISRSIGEISRAADSEGSRCVDAFLPRQLDAAVSDQSCDTSEVLTPEITRRTRDPSDQESELDSIQPSPHCEQTGHPVQQDDTGLTTLSEASSENAESNQAWSFPVEQGSHDCDDEAHQVQQDDTEQVPAMAEAHSEIAQDSYQAGSLPADCDSPDCDEEEHQVRLNDPESVPYMSETHSKEVEESYNVGSLPHDPEHQAQLDDTKPAANMPEALSEETEESNGTGSFPSEQDPPECNEEGHQVPLNGTGQVPGISEAHFERAEDLYQTRSLPTHQIDPAGCDKEEQQVQPDEVSSVAPKTGVLLNDEAVAAMEQRDRHASAEATTVEKSNGNESSSSCSIEDERGEDCECDRSISDKNEGLPVFASRDLVFGSDMIVASDINDAEDLAVDSAGPPCFWGFGSEPSKESAVLDFPETVEMFGSDIIVASDTNDAEDLVEDSAEPPCFWGLKSDQSKAAAVLDVPETEEKASESEQNTEDADDEVEKPSFWGFLPWVQEVQRNKQEEGANDEESSEDSHSAKQEQDDVHNTQSVETMDRQEIAEQQEDVGRVHDEENPDDTWNDDSKEERINPPCFFFGAFFQPKESLLM